jgi:hypothetical protein
MATQSIWWSDRLRQVRFEGCSLLCCSAAGSTLQLLHGSWTSHLARFNALVDAETSLVSYTVQVQVLRGLLHLSLQWTSTA